MKILAFDKTGTLTCGTPEMVAVESVSNAYSNVDLFRFAACAEQLSEHPLGKAVVRCYKKTGAAPLPAAEEFRMLPGRGVGAVVDGVPVLAGNPEFCTNRASRSRFLPRQKPSCSRVPRSSIWP